MLLAGCFPDLGDLSGGDGGVDAGSDVFDALVETSAPSGCDASFCDDFDDGGLGARWDQVIGDAGWLSLDAPALSPPRSLAAGSDGGVGFEFLEKFLTPTQRLHCTFQLMVDTMPTDYVDIFTIDHPGSTFVSSDTIFYIGQPGAAMREDVYELDGGCACPFVESTSTPFATGFWAPVDILYDFQTVTWSINGIQQQNAVRATTPRTLAISLGIRVDGAQSVSYHVDDLVCQVE